MADNLTTQGTTPATPPSGTVIATDDVAGVHFQKVKIDVGGDGASAVLSNSNPLPVSDAGGSLSIDDGGNVITVDGTVAVSTVSQITGSIAPGTGTTNLGKSEDAVAANGDVGVAVLAVRRDTAAVGSSASGDYSTFNVNANGELWTIDDTVRTSLGATSESAAATDTSTSGLNGLIKRLLQRVTSLIALFPTALTGSGNFKVAVVEDTVGSLTETEDGSVAGGQSSVAVTIPLAGYVFDGTNWVRPSEVKFAAVAASSSGDNTIVAAVTSKKIQVLSYVLSANGAVNAKWKSSTTTDKTGLLYCDAAGAGASANGGSYPLFETAAGEALTLNLSAAVAVGGHIAYREI